MQSEPISLRSPRLKERWTKHFLTSHLAATLDLLQLPVTRPPSIDEIKAEFKKRTSVDLSKRQFNTLLENVQSLVSKESFKISRDVGGHQDAVESIILKRIREIGVAPTLGELTVLVAEEEKTQRVNAQIVRGAFRRLNNRREELGLPPIELSHERMSTVTTLEVLQVVTAFRARYGTRPFLQEIQEVLEAERPHLKPSLDTIERRARLLEASEIVRPGFRLDPEEVVSSCEELGAATGECPRLIDLRRLIQLKNPRLEFSFDALEFHLRNYRKDPKNSGVHFLVPRHEKVPSAYPQVVDLYKVILNMRLPSQVARIPGIAGAPIEAESAFLSIAPASKCERPLPGGTLALRTLLTNHANAARGIFSELTHERLRSFGLDATTAEQLAQMIERLTSTRDPGLFLRPASITFDIWAKRAGFHNNTRGGSKLTYIELISWSVAMLAGCYFETIRLNENEKRLAQIQSRSASKLANS